MRLLSIAPTVSNIYIPPHMCLRRFAHDIKEFASVQWIVDVILSHNTDYLVYLCAAVS